MILTRPLRLDDEVSERAADRSAISSPSAPPSEPRKLRVRRVREYRLSEFGPLARVPHPCRRRRRVPASCTDPRDTRSAPHPPVAGSAQFPRPSLRVPLSSRPGCQDRFPPRLSFQTQDTGRRPVNSPFREGQGLSIRLHGPKKPRAQTLPCTAVLQETGSVRAGAEDNSMGARSVARIPRRSSAAIRGSLSPSVRAMRNSWMRRSMLGFRTPVSTWLKVFCRMERITENATWVSPSRARMERMVTPTVFLSGRPTSPSVSREGMEVILLCSKV